MTAPAPDVLEELTLVTPFGLGLWDVTRGALVSDGLRVRVFTLVGTEPFGPPPIEAQPNRSGFFVARHFPSLRAFEAGKDAWMPGSPPQVYLVEVRDAVGRFTPFVMRVSLPKKGLVLPHCVTDKYVPLFSTAARLVPAGMTAVRATLIVAATNEPAKFAILEVRESGKAPLLARGIANEKGEVAATFAYPAPATPDAISPPSSPSGVGTSRARPLTKQVWTLDITVRAASQLTTYTTDPTKPPLADLCDLLGQPEAQIVTTSPPALEPELHYGEELVLGPANGPKQLFINPA